MVSRSNMGVTLFSRGARKVTLTDEGMLLRRRAEEIVDLADKTEKELTERDELINGVVSVGCGELAHPYGSLTGFDRFTPSLKRER